MLRRSGSKTRQARQASKRQKHRAQATKGNTTQTENPYKYSFPNQYSEDFFWARPLKSKAGLPDPKIIYLGVGHALSNWEHVETSMSMLFSVFVDSFSTASSRAYGSIFGSRGKADAIEEAGKVFFAVRRSLADQKNREFIAQVDLFRSYFEVLLQNYRKASSRRNDIAHGMAYDLSEHLDSKQRAWFLISPMYQASHRGDIWVADDAKLRRSKHMGIGAAEARRYFISMVRKNSEYIYGVKEIQTYAGKFVSQQRHSAFFEDISSRR